MGASTASASCAAPATGQQGFDPLRRSRARHAVNHVAERDGLSENKPPAEEGFRLRAIVERINVGAKT